MSLWRCWFYFFSQWKWFMFIISFLIFSHFWKLFNFLSINPIENSWGLIERFHWGVFDDSTCFFFVHCLTLVIIFTCFKHICVKGLFEFFSKSWSALESTIIPFALFFELHSTSDCLWIVLNRHYFLELHFSNYLFQPSNFFLKS